MTMRTSLRIAFLGAALAGSSLTAQEDNKSWTAGANLTAALDSMKTITNRTNGFTVDFGYNGRLGATTIPFRSSLGYQLFPGATEENGSKQSLSSLQLAGDIFIASPIKNLQFITGLSLNKYKLKTEAPGVASNDETVKGVKFGARLGFEYRFNTAWSAQALIQMTELGTNADQSRGVNPSWAQFGVKYHF